ncbi:MAG TPA: hypothetical protein VK469_08490 [Candidatus Kapabacteria bacterium]|nr:hypothetical protein [Candidatus Kapabacteria bacterium]
MNQIKIQSIFKVLLGIFIITLFFNIQTFGLILGNRGGAPYDEAVGKKQNIESYIIEGAGYFLISNTDFLLFLNKIEMSELNGVDYNQIRTILDRAIENMEKANLIYTSLVLITTNTPYKQNFIERLNVFDYAGYQKQYGLNGIIFQEVALYLKNGDVTSIFTRILGRTGAILNSLYAVKKEIDANTFPGISNLWRLNQYYSETILFGQYSAEVFAKIN